MFEFSTKSRINSLLITSNSKWFYWLSDFDPKYEIPHYCNGNCNSMTGEFALKIWAEAQRTHRNGFRIEGKGYYTKT